MNGLRYLTTIQAKIPIMRNSSRYFSGFSFDGEVGLFNHHIPCNCLCISGFSLGAIEAVEYALATNNRIDRLVLLSPAFFNSQNEAFKKLQLKHFSRNQDLYMKTFYSNLSATDIDISSYKITPTLEELEKLLYYKWDRSKIESLITRGITIEVFIGMKDKIIQSSEAIDFFIEAGAVVYGIKNAGHILR